MELEFEAAIFPQHIEMIHVKRNQEHGGVEVFIVKENSPGAEPFDRRVQASIQFSFSEQRDDVPIPV